jgi:YVTN family beta-propeller protein
VISTAIDRVTATISVGNYPLGVEVTPDGKKVYVANGGSGYGTVSVIDAATDQVVGTPIPVGNFPRAFGLFLQPARMFAGTPGQKNCSGKSASALAGQYGSLADAAEDLGYPSVAALHNAIVAFCEG